MARASCVHLCVCLVVFAFLHLASSQETEGVETILDHTAQQMGQPLTITCAADRIVESTTGIIMIYQLSLTRQVGTARETVLAEFDTIKPDGQQKVNNIPASWNWEVQFSGTDQIPNIDDVKIQVFIPAVGLQDAGLYTCKMNYVKLYWTKDPVYWRSQNLTVIEPKRVLDEAKKFEGHPLTITCRADRLLGSTDNIKYIDNLILTRTVGSEPETVLAELFAFRPTSDQEENYVQEWGWEVEFQGAEDGEDNRDTFAILVRVPAVSLEDAGVYTCQMVYAALDPATVYTNPSKSENLTVEEQRDVLDYATRVEDEPLTIRCSADRLLESTDNIKYIDNLRLTRTVVGSGQETVLAQLFAFRPLNDRMVNYVPSTMQVVFSGAQDGDKNRDTFAIQVTIPAVSLEDAGEYTCQMDFVPIDVHTINRHLSKSEELIVTAGSGGVLGKRRRRDTRLELWPLMSKLDAPLTEDAL